MITEYVLFDTPKTMTHAEVVVDNALQESIEEVSVP